MEKISFRKAKASDYDSVNAFTRELFEYHKELAPNIVGNTEFENYCTEDFASETTDDDKAWFVAECGNEIVGTVLAYITANRFNKIYCYVDSLFVRVGFRECGIASGLMGKVEEFAKANGVDSIQLNICSNNEIGAKFYEKCGFKSISIKLEKEI